MINDDVVSWLLAADTPSIRYLTQTQLLRVPETERPIQALRKMIHEIEPVASILAEQSQVGHWRGESSYYTPKYRSTHWSMLLLVEFAVDPVHEAVQLGADYMLNRLEEKYLSKPWERSMYGLTCFWANVVRYCQYAGRGKDPRFARLVEHLTNDANNAWKCDYNWDLPCGWGAARALWGFAAIPPGDRSQEIWDAIESGLAFLLDEYSLGLGNYPYKEKIHPNWGRLNFPLFYQADILFTLRTLQELDSLDRPGARPALDWLEQRRQKNGRWRAARPYASVTWPGMLSSEEASRWVTLQAASILESAGR